MQDKEIKTDTINAFLDIGKTFDIPIMPRNIIHKILQKVGIRKKVLTYNLRKIKVGNRERISIRAMNLPVTLSNGTYVVKRALELSKANNEDLIYCAAVALQNDMHEPSTELLNALKWVDDEVLYDILEKGISNIDISNFFKSIVLIMGTESLMKTETQLNETSL